MNILLKYFIFFLMGIIIYYFLFNSPDIGAKKLIEGFDTTNLSTLLDNRRLYIKTPNKIVFTDGTASKASNAEGTFLNYDLSGALTLDHFTKNPFEALIGGPDFMDSPNSLTATNISNLLNSNDGNIKVLNVLPEDNIELSIPTTLNLTFKLENITNEDVSDVEYSVGPIRKAEYTDEPLISQLIGQYDGDNSITNDNAILYSNNGYHLIFKFNTSEVTSSSEETPLQVIDPFGELDLFIITPDTIPGGEGGTNIIGPSDSSSISNSFREKRDLSNIAQKITYGDTSYYVFKRTSRNLSEILTIFSDENIDFLLLNNQAGKTTQELVSLGVTQQNYNLSIQCAHTTLLDPTIAASRSVFTAVSDQFISNLPITTSLDLSGTNGLSTDPTPQEIQSMNEGEDKETIRTFQDAKVAYQYTFNVDLDLFKYSIIYNSVETDDVGSTSRGGSPLINSALLTFRTYIVDDNGRFDSLMGCGNHSLEICNHFNVEGENTATYWTAKDSNDNPGPSTVCNPAPPNSILRGIPSTAGSCYDDENLCCKPSGCSFFLQQNVNLCSDQNRENNYFGRLIDMSGDADSNAGEVCCGGPLHGYIEDLFNAIRHFNTTLLTNDDEKPTRSTITRRHILNYMYGSLIDLTLSPFNFPSPSVENEFGLAPVSQERFNSITEVLTSDVSIQPTESGHNIIGIDTGKLNEITLKNFNAELSALTVGGDSPTFTDFFSSITTHNNNEIERAIGQNSVVSESISDIQTGYNFFITHYIQNSDIPNTIENELKINLILLNVNFPSDVMGGNEMTPLEKSFPINSYNKSTLALYL